MTDAVRFDERGPSGAGAERYAEKRADGDEAGQPHRTPGRFTIRTYGRHGSLRKPGHGGSGVGAAPPGTTGSTSIDGCVAEYEIATSVGPGID